MLLDEPRLRGRSRDGTRGKRRPARENSNGRDFACFARDALELRDSRVGAKRNDRLFCCGFRQAAFKVFSSARCGAAQLSLEAEFGSEFT